MVQYYEQGTYANVLLLLLECKRRERNNSELQDLEQQLVDYVGYFFLDKGLDHRGVVFGGVAFGPKIRLYQCHRPVAGTNHVRMYPLWGEGNYVDERQYKDARVSEDAVDILNAFARMTEWSSTRLNWRKFPHVSNQNMKSTFLPSNWRFYIH